MNPLRTTLFLTSLALTAPAMATSGGKIGILERGAYVCELPGDAATIRGIAVPEENFSITNSSTYRTETGKGTYLRTGEMVTMTSGPKKGDRYQMKNDSFLRKLSPGSTPSGLRCIRLVLRR